MWLFINWKTVKQQEWTLFQIFIYSQLNITYTKTKGESGDLRRQARSSDLCTLSGHINHRWEENFPAEIIRGAGRWNQVGYLFGGCRKIEYQERMVKMAVITYSSCQLAPSFRPKANLWGWTTGLVFHTGKLLAGSWHLALSALVATFWLGSWCFWWRCFRGRRAGGVGLAGRGFVLLLLLEVPGKLMAPRSECLGCHFLAWIMMFSGGAVFPGTEGGKSKF